MSSEVNPDLRARIEAKSAKVGVIGLGYVGLPFLKAVAEAGYSVRGVDKDEEKVARINQGEFPLPGEEGNSFQLSEMDNTSFGSKYQALRDMDVISICVPTGLTPKKEPDLRPIKEVGRRLGQVINRVDRSQLVILQSTSFPATTERVLLPHLEGSTKKLGRNLFLAFSPERLDPGNEKYGLKNTPKVVGALTVEGAELAVSFLDQFIDRVVPVSSPRVAEMEKLMENIFRNVNIALVNELMILCDRMDIDIWEVIDAASTKPFGFMKFSPGPGVGGDCIPTDPLYLASKAQEYDFVTKLINTSSQVNWNVPRYVVRKVIEALNFKQKSLSGSKVLLLGAAFKKDVGDIRNSPAIKVAKLLLAREVNLSYNDRYVPDLEIKDRQFRSVKLTEKLLRDQDAVLILTDHSYYDFEKIVEAAPLVVDTRNATSKLEDPEAVVKI